MSSNDDIMTTNNDNTNNVDNDEGEYATVPTRKLPKTDEIDFNTEYSALMLAGKALCLAGDKKRYSQRRELLTLRANKWIPAKKNLKQQQASTDMDLYRSIVQQVFSSTSNEQEGGEEEKKNTTSASSEANVLVVDNEEGLNEGRVLKLQTKLCHALHWHEIQVKQIHLFKRHNKTLVKDVLKKEYKDLDESVVSQKIQDQIIRMQNEIQQLSEEFNIKIQKQHRQIDALKHLIEIHSIGSPDVSQHSTISPSTPEGGRRELKEEGEKFLLSTPPILRKSKIWNDLKRADEQDASRLWNVRKKCGLGLSSHGSSHITNHRHSDLGLCSPNASLHSPSNNSNSLSFSMHSPTMNQSNSSHKTKKIPGLRRKSSSSAATATATTGTTSMFSSILGNIGLADSFSNGDMGNDDNDDNNSFHYDDDGDSFHSDDDDEYYATTPISNKKSVTNQVTSFFSSSIDDITSAVVGGVDIGGGEPLSPTSRALKDLTEEVFSS